ncbi:MAG: HmuY family protein [Chitinivibrionia bacterium]|nr:HmuY family protein [Chitinivibrionia bacterium]
MSTVLLLIACVAPASGEIVKGYGTLDQGCWDFSKEKSVRDWDPGADACIAYIIDPPIGFMVATANYATVAVIDSAFDDVTTAPEDSSAYVYDYLAFDFVTYVVHTAEGHYAKFHILQFIPLVIIEYAYQSDGSRNLDTSVPVDATSWGRIKALYQ